MSQFTVYALVASDEPSRIRYVGATTTPLNVRLCGHLNDMRRMGENRMSGRKDHRKSKWIKATMARGAMINIKALSVHQTVSGMLAAEAAQLALHAHRTDLLNIDFIRQSLGKGKRKFARDKATWLKGPNG